MQQLRDPRTLKWGLWAVLILVIPSFVLFYGFDSGGADQRMRQLSLATVHGDSGRRDLDQRDMEAARNELAQSFLFDFVMANNRFPNPEERVQLESGLTNRQIADYAVSMVAFDELANRHGVMVSNDQISRQLREQGVTSAEFQQMLRQRGLREDQWLREQRYLMRNQRTKDLVRGAAKVSLLELWLEYKLREDRLTATTIRVPTRNLEAEVEVSEEEIVAHYEANPDRYMRPTQRKYRFIAMEPPPRSDEFAVSEEAVEAEYERLTHSRTPDLFRISSREFVLISLPESEEARNQLDAIASSLLVGNTVDQAVPDDVDATIETRSVDFATDADDLAAEFGPEWLTAIEDLGTRDVTEVLEVNGTLYVVQLRSVERARRPLEEIRPQLEARVRSSMEAEEDEVREEIIRDTQVRMMDLRRTRSSLDAIAQELNLETRQVGPVNATATFVQDVGDLRAYAELMRDLRQGEVSPVMRAERTDNLVVLEVLEVIPSAVRPLDEVRSQVETAVRRKKAAELAEQKANEIADRIRAGDSATSVALELDLEASSIAQPFTRLQPPSQLAMASDAVANRTLQMEQGEIEVLRAGMNDFVDSFIVFRLDSKREPNRDQFLDEMAALERQLQRAKGDMFIDEFRRDALRTLRVEYDENFVTEGRERRTRRSRRAS